MKYLIAAMLLVATVASAELWQMPDGTVKDLAPRDWTVKFPTAFKVGWYQPNAQTTPTIVPLAQSNMTPAQAAAWFSAKAAADQAAIDAEQAALRAKYQSQWNTVKTVLNNNGFTITTPKSFLLAYPDVIDWVATNGVMSASQRTQAIVRLPAMKQALTEGLAQ